jgi:hypothetical protein
MASTAPMTPELRAGTRRRGRLRPGPALLLLAALLAACGRDPDAPARASAEGWHEFAGSWSATGTRTTLQLGSQRRVAVVDVSGSLLLSGPTRPAVGFHGQALTFADEATGLLGRAVWTDEQGDELYSELTGARVDGVARIEGRFVGGSGRYASATGEYAFEWHYLIEADDGRVHGRTTGLAGRVRVDGAGEAPR